MQLRTAPARRPPARRRLRSALWGKATIAGAVGILALCLASPAGADSTSTSGAPSTTTSGAPSTVPPTTAVVTGPVAPPTPVPATTPVQTAGPGSTTTSTPSSKTTTTTTGGETLHGTLLAPHASVAINGVGSSFAAPAIETFDTRVSQAPYSLTVNYSSTSSGDGRYEFTNRTTDIAVTDIAYGLGSTDTTPPSYPYIYVPITAGGIAFMYNIPGLTKNLQLSSYSACAVMTGLITNWDNSVIAAGNPGVTLPNLHIVPVTESDSAGTNFVLEEWCIDEQPALWATFAHQEQTQQGGPTDGVVISGNQPNSNWPGINGGLDTQSTSQVAGDVATNSGSIGGVQFTYATGLKFGTGDPTKGVASVKNASGDYTQPLPVNVASALAYATQLPNGTHKLDFNGAGPHVYNPSTYSYLLTPTQGWQATKGAVLSGFVNYALTLGQGLSSSIEYASLGLSLEQFGINSVIQDVPGAVPVTAAEQAGYACGDLTPTEVAAGQTTPTCGVTSVTAPIPPAGGVASVGSGAGSTGSTPAGSHATSAGGSGTSGGSGGVASGSGAGVDPGVSLSGATPLAFTGGNPVPIAAAGGTLLIIGFIARRVLVRRRPERAP